ncbi:hypothetical protein PU629_20765 [Pullulanibacillus sp. KACC 23026]|uniref:hypothetical protein n=1 Tax=Pullulanibacillus sp. KACC 23026 TaxID=3028315 RepID=UPI0023B0289D|nr:hypothetical protein [Pullulanibacillus sp. KACC 23026]WEG12502.1 hypothetical protein PU629_20765 [Pullulanibacillus sp. KACC 23026]
MSYMAKSLLYLIFGFLFTYYACRVATPSVWNWRILFLVAFASYDVQLGLINWVRYSQFKFKH